LALPSAMSMNLCYKFATMSSERYRICQYNR
jgi:hypothetical protein